MVLRKKSVWMRSAVWVGEKQLGGKTSGVLVMKGAI